jgi:hypothetical protein
MNVVKSTLSRLLRPLVSLLLQKGMTFDEFSEVAKHVYIDVADQDFLIEGRKQTIARVAMLTGIQRKEVSRIQKLDDVEKNELDSAYNRGVRITSGWRRDKAFSNKSGPRALPLEGKASFAELVKKYSGDLPFKAVLDEFKRVGVVSINQQDKVTLVNAAGYVPTSSEADQLNILGQSAADLLNTIAYNLTAESDKRLQLTVAYNNLNVSSVKAFKEKSQQESVALLKEFDAWLSRHDRDITADEAPDGDERIRAGIGIYFFQEPYQEDSST